MKILKKTLQDGFNPQVFAAIIFIYFAALSGAIAFGGLMAEKTNNDIGIPETLLMSAVTGAVFALTAGCPLIIIGTTGPVLLFDEVSLFVTKASLILVEQQKLSLIYRYAFYIGMMGTH